MTTWIHVANNEHVAVVGEQKLSVFKAPYLLTENSWEVYVDEQQIGWSSSEVGAKYRALEGIKVKQNRGDRMETAAYALKILIEAFEVGNVSEDELAENTARIYDELLKFIVEPDA